MADDVAAAATSPTARLAGGAALKRSLARVERRKRLTAFLLTLPLLAISR